MASGFYNGFKTKLFNQNNAIDFDNAGDAIKVMLTTSAYTEDFDAHLFVTSITNEVVGTAYVAGGQALANKTVTQDNTDDEGVFDADDLTWAAATITARKAIIYKDTGVAATSPLIYCHDFGSDKISTGGAFTITWNAEGIINVN